LESATKAETKTSKVVDERFEKAINALIDYEMDCHRKTAAEDGRRTNSVRERMDAAKAKDKSSSSTLNALKEKSRMKVRVALAHVTLAFCSFACRQATPDEWSEPTQVVDFLLFKSLPDEAPIVVQRELHHVLVYQSNYLIVIYLYQRYSERVRMWQKFFGISTVARARGVLPSSRILTFIRVFRERRRRIGMTSGATRWRVLLTRQKYA
jgi:hypothetical protein